ncbi:MAG: hypothetical protein AAB785_01230 [Patescibacteria group bacterium]
MFDLINIVSAHANDQDWSSMMQNYGGHMGMMNYMFSMGGAWGWTAMIFGWIFGILVLLALILLIVWLIKQIQK